MEKTVVSLKGKNILVVEDDENLRNTIKEILLKIEAKVRTAENGLVAKTILEMNDSLFDVVLSDIKMPEMDGIQLLRYCKDRQMKCKFLIFTGFSEFLETHTASELGADAFLAKPFRLNELINTIDEILNTPPKIGILTTPEEQEQRYCCVRTSEFFSTTKLPSDLYIKVGAEKFIKLAKEGTEIDLNRVQQFRDRKIDYLYVRTEDFHKYTGSREFHFQQS